MKILNKKAEGEADIDHLVRTIAWVLFFILLGMGVIYFFKRIGIL